MSETYISVNHISKKYDKDFVLKDVTAVLRKGEILGFLGPSGAGKTTTIKLLTGQLHSDSGEVTVLGKDPFSPDIKNKIGIMSDMSGLYEKMTVYENLDLFADIYGIRDKKEKKRLMAERALGEIESFRAALAE